MKLFFITLFICFNINALAEPFSFQEINAIENFALTDPCYLKSTDGINLAYYPFVNPDSKNIVILYAGAGLYGNKTYQWVAKTLQEKYHISCYIFDIRGHGHSDGIRGDGLSVQQILQDVHYVIQFVKNQNPNSKIYLCGHSSGAGLIINYAAASYPKLENGYIFLAPYFGPKSNTLQDHKNSSTNFISSVRTWLYIAGAIFSNSFLIHWTAVWFNYPEKTLKTDPLIVPSYSYVMSMATTPYEIDNLLKNIAKPTAIYIGDKDEQFIPEKVLAYQKSMPINVDTKLINNANHLSILLQAPELIAQFIKKQDFNSQAFKKNKN